METGSCPAQETHQCAGWLCWKKELGLSLALEENGTGRCGQAQGRTMSHLQGLAVWLSCGNSQRWPQNSINNTGMVNNQQHLETAPQGMWEQRQEGGILLQGLCSVSPTFRPPTPSHSAFWTEVLTWAESLPDVPFFLPLAAGDTEVASSHCGTVENSHGSGQEPFQHLWRWLVPSPGFFLHQGSFFLVLAAPRTVSCRIQQWGHEWSVQRTPQFSGKQLQWELLTRSCCWECCRQC